jgi:hypothetical protein
MGRWLVKFWHWFTNDQGAGGSRNSAEAVQAEIVELRETLEFFANHETQFNEAAASGIVAKRGEHIVGVVSEVGLVESRKGPTQFSGGALGFSFRLTDRLAVRPSRFRGSATPGEEAPALIDSGRFVISDKRAVFIGGKQTREFDWDKVLAYELRALNKKSAIVYLPVSNRQKVSGIAADTAAMNHVYQRVAFGIAVATGRKDDFLNGLREAIAEAETELRNLTNPSV